MKFYIKPTQEHPNEKGEYALIQEGTLCLFTGQSYEETANEEKFKIAFNKLSSKQKEQDFIECEIDDKFKFKSLKIELQDTDNYEVNPINEADKQKGIIKPCLFEKAPCPLRFKRKKTGILIGLIKAYKQDKNKEFIDDISSLNNPHNEIYTIDIEQEIQLRAFVYEEQRTRVEKDKVTDSNTQQKRDYKEEQGNITKTIKDISNNEAQNIKWAFKLSNYDNIELNPLLQKDKKGFIRLNQSGDSIRFALKDILKDGQNINSLVDKTITFFAYVNSPTSKIYSELYQTNNSTRENERIVKQDRVTSIELKIIQTRFKLEFDGQTLQFLENERVMGEWNARSGVAIENKINNAEIKPKNRASVYLSQADKNKSFYYDDPKNTQDFLPEIEDNESYFVTVPLDKRAYMLASSTKTSDLASYLSSVTPLSLDFFNLAISKQDDKNSLQVVAQIDNHQFKTKQEDNNNKNINLGYSYDDFIQTLLAHINSKETIDIPLNVKYQKRILITIERFKETTESTMSKMNIFIDGKRVDSKGNFIEKLTTKGTKEYEMFNPFSLPNDENNYAYILERNGPDCIGGELKLRIPEGRYNASWHSGNLRQRVLRLHNDFVSYNRAILIHEGYKSSISPRNSKGCLIIGKERVKDKNNVNFWADNILKADENHSKKEALAKAIEQKGFINSYLAKSKGKDKISANEVAENIEVKIKNNFNKPTQVKETKQEPPNNVIRIQTQDDSDEFIEIEFGKSVEEIEREIEKEDEIRQEVEEFLGYPSDSIADASDSISHYQALMGNEVKTDIGNVALPRFMPRFNRPKGSKRLYKKNPPKAPEYAKNQKDVMRIVRELPKQGYRLVWKARDFEHLKQIWKRLTKYAKKIEPRNDKKYREHIDRTRLKDKTEINFRQKSKSGSQDKSGDETIDIKFNSKGEKTIWKIHY